ncbi:MAG: methyltransferase [Alphaproteobacteria bacterium]|nr:methyltransferase [Alphaproteobacteria bacterium]
MASAEYEAYYRVIRCIPKGRVMTYGDVAIAAGRPGNARRVGYALHALKDERVPWWRVVNAGGGISIRGGFGEGAEQQRDLLELEGVELIGAGRLRLADYRYVPNPSKQSRGTQGKDRVRRRGDRPGAT